MAAFYAKMTLQFAGLLTRGWSENYWWSTPGYNAGVTMMDQLIDNRKYILHASYFITGARISNDLKGTRDSYLANTVLPVAGNLGVAGDSNSPPSQMGLMCREEASPFVRGTRFLHGIPINQFTSENYTPTIGFSAVFANFRTFLFSNNFLLRTIVGGVVNYQQLITLQPLAWRSRRIGRPSGLLVGRRRVR